MNEEKLEKVSEEQAEPAAEEVSAPAAENAAETGAAEAEKPETDKQEAPEAEESGKKSGRSVTKILLAALAAVCLLLAVVFGVRMGRSAAGEGAADTAPAADGETAGAEESAAAEQGAVEIEQLDYDAIYALHDPQDIVLRANGEDITWAEYFSWFYMGAAQVENYMMNMKGYYGMDIKWTDQADENTTYAEYAVQSAKKNLSQMIAIDEAAQELGFVKDEEYEKILAEQVAGDMLTVCGEGATEEEFYETIAADYLSREAYERMSNANAIYGEAFYSAFGEELEKIDEKDVVDFLKENDYTYANHILLTTMDLDTNEELSAEQKSEKFRRIKELHDELAAIEDPDALVKRFRELKEEYCEDTGKTAYPNGYYFTPGTMVSEFEEVCGTLDDYGLSDIVVSAYGYHLILKLPLDADSVMGYNSDGSSYNGRILYADNVYNKAISDHMENMAIEDIDGLEAADVLDHIKK